MIISFSGIDSAGKTTQVELLQKYCARRQLRTKRIWSKARGTPGVCLLKTLVRKDRGMNDKGKKEYRDEFFADPKKERLLYIASLLDLCWYWGIYFRILSLFYDFLICDRYLWDTYIELTFDFQSVNVDSSLLWKCVKCISPKPKHAFVFVVPAEVSLARDKQKDADGIETVEKKTKKINMYLEKIQQQKWTDIMDGTKSIENLHQEVKAILGIAE